MANTAPAGTPEAPEATPPAAAGPAHPGVGGGGEAKIAGAPPATTLSELLAPYGGRAPPLPDGCRYHFYLVKHERYKYQALAVATALRDELGFSVWLSQWEGQAGRDVDEPAMQRGIRESAAILLLVTPGIFEVDRKWCTHTELKYGIDLRPETCQGVAPGSCAHGKPLVAINFGVKLGEKLPACSHPSITCANVRADFQPYARAMLRALNISDWANDRFDQPAKLCKIVDRYLNRDRAAIKMQQMLADELVRGECKVGTSSSPTSPALSASSAAAAAAAHTSAASVQNKPLGNVPRTPRSLSADVHADKLEQVVTMLLSGAADSIVGFVGIKAMGGQGKTILLSRVAREDRILARFARGVVWIDVGRDLEDDVVPLLEQLARFLQLEIDKDAADRAVAIKDALKTLGDGNDLLLLLDNVWSSSLEAVQDLIEACPERTRVVLTSRDSSVVEELEGEQVDLNELSLDTAIKMLREQCRGKVVLTDMQARDLAKACCLHVLALEHVGAQLRLKCGGRRGKCCSPSDVLALIQDRARSLSEKFQSKGKRVNVDACLALSLEDLEGEPALKRLALGLAVFPVEREIPLGALVRLCRSSDRSGVRRMVAELDVRSIVSVSDKDVISVHGLMHGLLEGQAQAVTGVAAAATAGNGGGGESKSEDDGVKSALRFFEAYHYVRSSTRFDALREATEKYGKELADVEELVLAAIEANGAALGFCSERLRGEERCVRAAMESFGYEGLGGLFPFGEGVVDMAERMLRRDVDGAEQVLGAEHPSTLASIHILAGLLSDRGRLDEAEALYRHALEARERVLGAEHPNTLNSARGLKVIISARTHNAGRRHKKHPNKQKPNEQCVCGSGKKTKKCCKNHLNK
jgi:hypothetical protein